MKILIIGATHGNELLGTKLYARLLRKRAPILEHIDFLVGNPRAYAAKKRYIECDLNRSYESGGDQYEECRAREIKQYIARTRPDLVLDMHTTNCEQPNCLIVSGTDGEVRRRLLRASHIDHVLQVRPMGDIATLGNFVVGYEVPNRHIDSQLLDDIAGDLQRFIDGVGGYKQKKLYVMQDKIYKRGVSPQQVASFVNFELHPELGYVPVMTGKNSYVRQTDYCGFKASPPQEITV